MTGLIILAAGESARLGQPKQNLVFGDKTLLQNAVETGLASVCQAIIVVLGANEEVIMPTVNQYPVNIVHNADWAEGMASSIRLGIAEAKKNSGITSVIFMLCDQPFVSTGLLNELAAAGAENDLVACVYNNTAGVPVLFTTKYFGELQLLTGDEGAKQLLLKYGEDVLTIPFRMGGVDIDTMNDYEKLRRSGNLS